MKFMVEFTTSTSTNILESAPQLVLGNGSCSAFRTTLILFPCIPIFHATHQQTLYVNISKSSVDILPLNRAIHIQFETDHQIHLKNPIFGR